MNCSRCGIELRLTRFGYYGHSTRAPFTHPPDPFEPPEHRLARLLESVERTGECWTWLGWKTPSGYGQVRAGQVHRVIYELTVGPIPRGLTLDHLCRNRACVNPGHLEPVTIRENVLRGEGLPARNARKTHCDQGHVFDEANTYIRPDRGTRMCRKCRVAAVARVKRRHRHYPRPKAVTA